MNEPTKKVNGKVHSIQMELFAVEYALNEFETKRKLLKAQLAMLGVGSKVCTKCELEMDIEQFYRDKQKIDLRSSWCMDCVTKAERDRKRRKAA